jgi:hypothetical protein
MSPRTLATVLSLLVCLPFIGSAGAGDSPGDPKQPAAKRPDAASLERRLADLEAKLVQMTKDVQGIRNDLKVLAPAPERPEFRIYSLKNAHGTKLAETLQEFLGENAIRIVCDPQTNTLLVRGDRDQLELVETLVSRLDEAAARPAAKPRESSDGGERNPPR